MKSERVNRMAALALALVWIIAGTLGLVLGILGRLWVLPVVGCLAIGYGVLWLRVSRRGKRLGWREAFWPWK